MATTTSLTSHGPLFTVLVVVLAVLFAVLAGLRAATFRRATGRNPWGVPPLAWTLIGFFLGLIGLCLALLACWTTRVGGLLPPAGTGRAPVGPPPPAAPGRPPAGWYPDPSGRHEYRFFTGSDWTDDVVDHGAHSSEPLPAPPLA